MQELGGEEHPEADAGIFDVEAGDDFRFGLEQLERRARHLGQRSQEEGRSRRAARRRRTTSRPARETIPFKLIVPASITGTSNASTIGTS